MILRLLIFIVASLSFMPAWADDCGINYEEIIRLRTPEYPSDMVWNTVYGAREMEERFSGGALLENGNILVAGQNSDGEKENAGLLLIELGPHGRVQKEQVKKIPGLESVVKLVKNKSGLVVFGKSRSAKTGLQIWLGFLNEKGEYLKSKQIASFATPQDIISLQNSDGFLIAAAAKDRGGISHAVLYKINTNGGVIFKRAIAPGLDNAILSLAPAGPGQYIAAGYMQSGQGRRNGWLALLNDKGEILWQRQYPRGKSAALKAVAWHLNHIVAAGESTSGADGSTGAWVMMLDKEAGNVLWQRFYTGDRNYSAIGLLPGKEDLFTVMIEDTSPSADGRDSTRLVTLTPRGETYASDEFLNGAATKAVQIVEGSGGERILLGSTQTQYSPTPEAQADEKTVPYPKGKEAPALKQEEIVQRQTMDGWAMAAVSMPPFQDSCIMHPEKK